MTPFYTQSLNRICGGYALLAAMTFTSTAWCADDDGQQPIYGPGQVTVTAENSFGPAYAPSFTVDNDCHNRWLNDIFDLLPTWIQYQFPASHLISKVAVVHSNYEEEGFGATYRMRNYQVQVSNTPGCPDASFVTVAANTGGDVNREYQETVFAPVTAQCVRIRALYPSYETIDYPPCACDEQNWVGLTAFQAFEHGTGRPILTQPCAFPPVDFLCPDCATFENFSATVAIHVSETTEANWSSLSSPGCPLGVPHPDWKPWHVSGFLMEQLRADGTPFEILDDAEIASGMLMSGNSPRYAIVFSLANDCISNAVAARFKDFVTAGGHAFVGSTSWTRDQNGALRTGSGSGGTPIYSPGQVIATAENSFGPAYVPGLTVDLDCSNRWLNDIADLLPTWIQYKFPAQHVLSRVAVVHSNYSETGFDATYRIRNYEVQISTDLSCADASFVTVAANTGANVNRQYQETAFTPTNARCVRIRALYPSYETIDYLPCGCDEQNWIGLTAFQAFENGTDRPLIDHSCAPSNFFALSAEMGLMAGCPILVGNFRRSGVDDPLVSHLEDDTAVRGWKLAKTSWATSFSHPDHWAQKVVPLTATVLALTEGGDPLLTVKDYGAGRFIYHAEFNPLAGYSMHTVANLIYGFYRKAIDQAHFAQQRPNVRLGAWRWPYVAGFMTCHDHMTNFGFDGVPGTGDDAQVAQIESARGVRGNYFLRTNYALCCCATPFCTGACNTTVHCTTSGSCAGPCPGPCDGPCTDPSFGSICNPTVRANLLNMVASGAHFGSHTTDETQEAPQCKVEDSLDRLQAYLGFRPKIFFPPGGSAMRDTTKQGLVNAGILTTGAIAFGAHPHFALRIDDASITDYGDAARFPLVEIPYTGYYGLTSLPAPPNGPFAGGVWGHEITANHPGCDNDGTVRPCMEKAADLQYELGGIINLYDHIGDIGSFPEGSDQSPTVAEFTDYIDYAQSLPYVDTTDHPDLQDWWQRRNPVKLYTTYTPGTSPKIAIDVCCAVDPGPFSVEVDLPWGGCTAVTVNGNPSITYVLDGSRIRVAAPAFAKVVITKPYQQDIAVFDDCLNGPEMSPNPSPPLTSDECLCAYDTNDDDDVDLEEFAAFQAAF